MEARPPEVHPPERGSEGPVGRALKTGLVWGKVEVTTDSGAADAVGPRTIGKGIPIQETKASKLRVTYTAANDEIMPSVGQKRVQGYTSQGRDIGLTFQVTDVRKIFASVREMCTQGNRVVFDDDGSFVLNKKSGIVTPLEKRSGTYAFDRWIQVQENQMDVDAFIQEGGASSSKSGQQAGDAFECFSGTCKFSKSGVCRGTTHSEFRSGR